jgi:hypothetical protein
VMLVEDSVTFNVGVPIVAVRLVGADVLVK